MFFKAHGSIENREPKQAGLNGLAMMEWQGRNRIINGDFSVNQRAFTSTGSPNVYGFDRWYQNFGGGTSTYSTQAIALGNRGEGRNHARIVTSGQSSSTDFCALIQRIEGVRTLQGKTVTVSFWAKAGSGTPRIGVEFVQRFGGGGSPSAEVRIPGGFATASTAWDRYSITLQIPSVVGKTLGTDGTDNVQLGLWVSGGSGAVYQAVGIQNNTFDIWGVQVEEGPHATAYEQKTYAQELRDCQRYFQRWIDPPLRGVVENSTTLARMAMALPVTMRTAPTVTYGGTPYCYDAAYAGAVTSVAAWYNSPSSIEADLLSSGGTFVNGNGAALYHNGGSSNFDLTAEL